MFYVISDVCLRVILLCVFVLYHSLVFLLMRNTCLWLQQWIKWLWILLRSVFISWLLPCDLFIPLAMLFLLGERWVSCSPSLQELSLPLPEQLPESDELLLPLLLICSITSTSARSSETRANEKDLAKKNSWIQQYNAIYFATKPNTAQLYSC